MNKEKRKNLENWLNERWQIALKTDEDMGNTTDEFLPNNPDFIYYKGIIDTLRCLGIDWKRENHNHIIF